MALTTESDVLASVWPLEDGHEYNAEVALVVVSGV